MDVSLQKTVGFLVFIGIGLLLKVKFRQKEETTGIKKIILNLALPATIFIALLSVELKKELFLLPFLALILNLLLFFIFPFLLPLCGIRHFGIPNGLSFDSFTGPRFIGFSLHPGIFR